MPFMCCSPLAKRQPFQCVHSSDVFSGQSKLERIRSGTLIVIPPSASMTSLNRGKSTVITWLIGSPV